MTAYFPTYIPKRHCGAFTLIEILVAVGIIALLAGIAFSVLSRVRGKARQATCLSNERQLGLGCTLYAEDYDGFMPSVKNYAQNPPKLMCAPGMTCDPALLHQILLPYVRSYGFVWFCPEDAVAGKPVEQWFQFHQFSSYDYNLMPYPKLRIEGAFYRDWDEVSKSWSDQWPASTRVLIEDPNSSLCPPGTYLPWPAGGNHFDGVNIVFLDGHGKWTKMDECH